MVRVGVVMQHYKIHGGIESCVYSLIEALNGRGITPIVIGRLNDPSEEEGIHHEIRERFGRSVEFSFLPLWVDRFRKRNRLVKITQDASPYLALQLPFLNLDITYDFLEALPLRVPRGRYVKYLNFFIDPELAHAPMKTRKTGAFLDMMRMRAFSRGYPIFLNSQFSAETAAPVFGRRLPVIYPPVAVSRFWSTRDQPRRGIVSWGRFAPDKRNLDLVKAADHLHQSGFDEPFLLVGGTESFPAYYETVRGEVAARGLSNVKTIANRPMNEVIQILRSAAVYVHTTPNEPFGITTAEAMAAGCVPLVHDSGGQREVVPWRELRWADLPELESKLRALTGDPDRQRTWRGKCQEHVSSFSEERFQQALLAFLDDR